MNNSNFDVKFQIESCQDNSVSRKLLIGDHSAASGSNVKIHVTNLDTLDEFEGSSVVNNDYLPKLQSWINKKKYLCSDSYSHQYQGHQDIDEEGLQLQVDIFKFYLKKIEKSDMEKIKEEMEALKAERLQIDREMKLFNFYFFSQTNKETSHKSGLGPGSFNQMMSGFGSQNGNTIFGVDQLFYTIQAQGVVEVANSGAAPPQNGDQPMIGSGETTNLEASAFSDELSRSNNQDQQSKNNSNHSSRPQFLLELKEPLAHDVMQLSLNNMGPHSKNFEFLLWGQGCKSHIVAKMAKQYIRKTVHVDVTLYYYPVNVSVKNGGGYTLYIPKSNI